MPLVIVTGYPSSGKTTTARRVAEALTTAGLTAHVVSENDHVSDRASAYADSRKEKTVKQSMTCLFVPPNTFGLE
jgi:tRNA uridine 5-carbamoylmethylation protein Kti12